MNRRIRSASANLRSLSRSVVAKNEVSRRARMTIFINAVSRPTLTYGHEQWRMIERIRSRIRAAEMKSCTSGYDPRLNDTRNV